ncbi:MAG: MATE family efflux transporter [Eubacteriales bacterium]|nr:MATE family efflux transporter [Eubacteriales bacterium]
MKNGSRQRSQTSLTEGPIGRGILAFAIPLFLGQLLQQLYNMADAWVVGNFADNDAFAAVSMATHISFLIIGFFNGIAIGGGVVISRYFGAKNETETERAIHTNFLFGIAASVISTVVGVLLVPHILVWMHTPDSVMPDALTYFRIYFAGVSTIIMYNICMAIMRALGDSLHPLYYLIFSSLVNVVLDLVFVAGMKLGVGGAAIATVISQGLSAILCMIRMCRVKDYTALSFRKLHFHKNILSQVIRQGLPSGVQNSVISIGNLVVQANINSFGAYAISGHGAYSKVEGLVFLPIMSMSMALPTFISQNLGAGEYDRAKKGAAFGIISGMVMAELVGVLLYFGCGQALQIFVDTPEAIKYGTIHGHIVTMFFCLLAFSHCAAGVMRGCGKSMVPMVVMLLCWCGIRIVYVTVALRIVNEFRMISWAYPLTWTLSSLAFLVFLRKSDWVHGFEQ